MALFDLVNFNGEVFDAVVRETPNLRLNELLHCGKRCARNNAQRL